MTNVVFKDDGKGKWQSHEAHANVESNNDLGHFTINITAYGSARTEVAQNMRRQVLLAQAKLSTILQTLDLE